jgi:biopolymer transport protein ExbD
MKRRRTHQILNEEIGLQIAPMIDVTMLLLFFFMLSTTLERRCDNEKLELPIAKSDKEFEQSESPLVIFISSSGRIVLNGTLTSFDRISAEVASHARDAGARIQAVEINADSATPCATIKKLLSAITRGGAKKVAYVTRSE